MLKYILLLCLILQLGACKKIHVRQRSEDAAVKQVEPVVAKENVETKTNDEVTENTTHVVKKDHPEESNNEKEQVTEVTAEARHDVQVKSDVTAEETPVPVEVNEKGTNKNEEEEVAKIDKEESIQEKGSSKNAVGTSKQSLLNTIGIGDVCRVNNQIGTCTPSSLLCLSARGTVLGSLGANGQCPALSVCCQIVQTCGQSSAKRSIIFGNPTQFDSATSTCDFTVNVVDPKVCQIRLDFTSFLIAGPRQTPNVGNSPFTCMDDSFQVISSSNERIPIICGFNTDQHMYIRVNFTNGERSIRLRFNLAGRPSTIAGVTLTNPQWSIRITQLECNQNIKPFIGRSLFPFREQIPLAPPGCLQYFPARSGTIRNFGFNPNSAIAANNYIANMDYSICFRRTSTTCGMKLSPGAFMMSGNADACTQGDFLTVPEGVITRADGSKALAANARVCANMLPANTFIQSVGNFPTYVHFVTDNVNNNNENGFNLNYEVPPANNCM